MKLAGIYPLFSSSKGNAVFVGDSNAGILIDCGVSCKRLLEALDTCDIPLSAVKGIFITHEHSDHISGLPVFTKKLKVPVFASEKTLDHLIKGNYISPLSYAEPIGNDGIDFCGMRINAFETPHDAVQSCGYKIETSDSKKIAVCTDLGEVTPIIKENLSGCDCVLIESNYDEHMLKTGVYPYYLKQRISSRKGHLANSDCAKQVRELLEKGTTRIILGHLSQENNTPQTAEKSVLNSLSGFKRNSDYILTVAPVCTTGACCLL